MSKLVGITYRFEEKATPYAAALRFAGVEPVLMQAGSEWSLEGIDGLLVSGGTDVDPALYGQAPHEKTEAPDQQRDELERRLLGDALGRDLPMLAICRGMQVLNVMLGGTLVQHAEGHVQRGVDKAHRVLIEPRTRLAAIVGAGAHSVNSRHHQIIGRPADGLQVSALSESDGVIEGVEIPEKRFAIAVQWHPEDMIATSPLSRKLFAAFAAAL